LSFAAPESESPTDEIVEKGSSLLARRIGYVYTVEDLARWLGPSAGDPLTTNAVLTRANDHQLVGFLTDDNQWAFPAWQFDETAERLVLRYEVVMLWQQLPHDGVLSDIDLAAWMNTRITSLDGGTPVEWADRHGAGDEVLAGPLSRLRTRAA